MMATDLSDEYAGQGRYPASLAMNARLFGTGTALLQSIPGDEGGVTCNIQITSFANEHWEGSRTG